MRNGLLAAAAAAVLVTGCGGGEESSGQADTGAAARAASWVDPDGTEPVVGSLAVDPAGGGLWLASNVGLYRVREGGKPQQVSGTLRTPFGDGRISEQLVVVPTAGGELIGSGHPASDSSLPPALGLIRSRNGGRRWESVSELGAADFHVLRQSREQLVGALYGEAQILVSEDGGKTWRTRAAPRPLVDLAVDPSDPDRWVGTTRDGIFASTDGGGSWRPVDVVPNVRLAWAHPESLYRVDPGGPVLRSADGGRKWTRLGSTGGEPQALAADGPQRLYAALLDGTIKRSSDGGKSWSVLLRPDRQAG